MAYDNDTLDKLFEKTGGQCNLCHGEIRRNAYGVQDSPVGWEVDHSRPRAAGGTDHFNNLFPAHVSCNRSKQANTTASARTANGVSGAPRPAPRYAETDDSDGDGTALVARVGKIAFGTAVGGWLGGRVGALIGGVATALFTADDE